MRVVILDDAGRFLRMAGVDEVGTIAITGPNVFAGYLDPQQNKDLWIDIEGSRWLNTGDLGRRDGLGYFWLAGRRKELIIRGGHNIDPKRSRMRCPNTQRWRWRPRSAAPTPMPARSLSPMCSPNPALPSATRS
jgi:hypothetical protein